MPAFVEQWVEDKARHRLVRDIAIVESEYPAHTATGVASGFFWSNEEYCTCLLSCPSSRWFKPRMLIMKQSGGHPNEVNFYVGGSAASCSATLFGMFPQAYESPFIGLDCITVGGDIWVSCQLSGLGVRIAGVLVNSGPEN